MFGLKLIKDEDYQNLQELQRLYDQKVNEVIKLEAQVKSLESNIASLNSKINSLINPKVDKKVELLTDVAEKPLTQVKKKTGSKKTGNSTRKIVHKTKETN